MVSTGHQQLNLFAFSLMSFQAFPVTAWSKWPYSKGRIDLYETVVFNSGKVPPNGTFNGKLVYFRLDSRFFFFFLKIETDVNAEFESYSSSGSV